MKKLAYSLSVLISIALITTSYFQLITLSMTEVLGFITGALCVWLVVKENIWNWPIGIVNNIFFVVLFFEASLFADMGLQVVYIVLGFLGWYWWLRGGKNKTTLKVGRIGWLESSTLVVVALIATGVMTRYLESINDSAPFLDALTTVMSLVAQYMLTKKLIENWGVWISVDVIYIGLYIYKDLYLTAALYLIFLLMCIKGWYEWRKSLELNPEAVLSQEIMLVDV